LSLRPVSGRGGEMKIFERYWATGERRTLGGAEWSQGWVLGSRSFAHLRLVGASHPSKKAWLARWIACTVILDAAPTNGAKPALKDWTILSWRWDGAC
jgi:hypothetical protein